MSDDPAAEADAMAADDAAASQALAAVEHPEVIEARDAAVHAAADLALQTPGIPGRDEFLALAMLARTLSMSSLVPRALQGKPHDTFLVLLTGRDLQLPTTAALRKVYVVDGQPSLAPQLSCALIRQKGLGRIQPHPDNSDTWAAAIPLGPDGRQLGPQLEFSWEAAQVAELVDPTCQPNKHNRRTQTRYRKGGGTYEVTDCDCKDNWKHYPRRMLWWRAAGYCADDYFPEVSMGLYSPDELGAVIDVDGEPVDPATAALPPGFEPPLTGEEARRAALTPEEREAEDRAVEAARAALQDRIMALPDDRRAELKERWESSDRLGRVHISHLDPRDLRVAEALVRGVESSARAAGWDADAALAAVRARREPQPAPEPPPAADAPEAQAAPADAPAPPPEPGPADPPPPAAPGFPPLFHDRYRPAEGPLADKKVTAGGLRLVNIALSDMGITGDARLVALSQLLGRPIASTKDLTEGEARAVAAAVPPAAGPASADQHAAEVLAETTNGGGDVQRIIDEVAAMPMTDVSARLQALGLPRAGSNDDRRIRLATRLVEDARGRPLTKEVP